MGAFRVKKKASITANIGKLRKIYGITCAAGGCAGRCDELGGTYGDYEFERCPVAELSDRRWSVVLELWNASRVSPLMDWPEGWAPWIVRGLSDLRSSLDVAKAEATKEALNA